jgi:3-methylcrotonyl-CoA carboxylase alpha subunit
MFRRLLIANRGEIACRITETAHRLGLEVIAVYSDADARARHVRKADAAWPLGASAPAASYLNVERILDAARAAGADAVHPGYGFLAENASFAGACAAAGIAFVGPPVGAIAAMGEKAAAKARMQRAGIPVLAGYHGEDQALATLEREGRALGFPLLIKPSAGGGGKGMQIVTEAADLHGALESARRIARSAFADERLLLERYLSAPRHVEVQVLADQHGGLLHLHDRDCSVQRRHQKLIEEAPAPQLDAELRSQLAAAACKVAREIGYVGAGTVEFLVDGSEFFFMEMNTRLQVEHPVTEAITGLDLVEWQLRIAAGEPLTLDQASLPMRGHAIEVRVCAEDPGQDFLPGSGRLLRAAWPPPASGARSDVGFDEGDEVPPYYDSLLGKIVAHAPTREEANRRLRAALRGTRIAGVPTNLEWLAAALDTESFRAAAVSTAFVERERTALTAVTDPAELVVFAAAARVLADCSQPRGSSPWEARDGFRLGGTAAIEMRLSAREKSWLARVRVLAESSGLPSVEVSVPDAPTLPAQTVRLQSSDEPLLHLLAEGGGAQVEALAHGTSIHVWRDFSHAEFHLVSHDAAVPAPGSAAGSLTTMLPGVVVNVLVEEGERVASGQALLVIEAMKMEHTIRAPHAGLIRKLKYRVGERVKEGSTLLEMESA